MHSQEKKRKLKEAKEEAPAAQVGACRSRGRALAGGGVPVVCSLSVEGGVLNFCKGGMVGRVSRTMIQRGMYSPAGWGLWNKATCATSYHCSLVRGPAQAPAQGS